MNTDVTSSALSSLLRALAPHMPSANIISQNDRMRPFEADALTMFKQLPLCVVLPENETQLKALLCACSALNIGVVTRGAGTGLSGGATPSAGAVLLVMSKFNCIIEVDGDNGVACVQAGVRNAAISEAAAVHGLYYAPDPSSQIACSIGGNVAENSGGVHCLKYGLTVHNVLKVRVMLMSGEVIELGGLAPDAVGLDLLPVFIGSEGMLGVVTTVWVKLVPKPRHAEVILASFPTVQSAADAVANVIAAGLIPAGLEMMDAASTAAVEAYLHAGYDLEAAALLLCESDGEPDVVAQEIAAMSQILREAGATRLQVSQNEAERLKFWAGRKSAFPAAARLAPDYYCMDGTIPRKSLGRILTAIAAMEQEFGLQCLNVFHAGDGNMHPMILFNGADPDEVERAEHFGAKILEASIALGGTITGEHGVGLEKIGHMCMQFTDEERGAMWAVKAAFDPPGLLNADKAIPTLHRCAEFGRMHVHHGEMPFPDLPRF
ncbi:putative FAD-linked oxidoreductase [Ephemeroptericola cinctiostellae]|uniref:Putative FAD-linked oxidoreductase n=1 Tax=Ephemeroptericola cinctiostellae TaxID=2268024 RepID=A0A345DDD6_9BURK|nr:FAD-linked oxidase C-terminal domain-containing protein [Ephemeroptericola cinctiostellae]AXF86374.1 putative FAD-linked oxidoreductase [Ephemeroptericola cinctiostellae]